MYKLLLRPPSNYKIKNKNFIKTISLENEWLKSKNIINLTSSRQKNCIAIGKSIGIQNISCEIPEIGIIGDFIYQIDPDDERILSYAFQKNGKLIFKKIDADSYYYEKDICLNLLAGVSFFIYNNKNFLKEIQNIGTSSPYFKMKSINYGMLKS